MTKCVVPVPLDLPPLDAVREWRKHSMHTISLMMCDWVIHISFYTLFFCGLHLLIERVGLNACFFGVFVHLIHIVRIKIKSMCTYWMQFNAFCGDETNIIKRIVWFLCSLHIIQTTKKLCQFVFCLEKCILLRTIQKLTN